MWIDEIINDECAQIAIRSAYAMDLWQVILDVYMLKLHCEYKNTICQWIE